MKITNLKNVSFKGAIIDSHAHIGEYKNMQFGIDKLDVFTKEALSNGDTVEKMLISSLDCLIDNGKLDELEGNKKLLGEIKNKPQYYPLAVCQPHKTNGKIKNIEKLFSENPNKFIGLKFHPRDFNLLANSPLHDKYMKFAQTNKLPCLFHCDGGKDGISSPKAIYELAKRHKDVPTILGHMGAGGEDSHIKAIDVLEKSIKNNDAKLYVDISWVDWKNDLPSENPESVIKVVKMLKEQNALDRILFGTDAPLGCYGEKKVGDINFKQAYEMTIERLKNAIKTNFPDDADSIINKIFHDNAEELFFTKNWAKVQQTAFKNSKTKILAIAFTGLAVIAGGIYGIIKNTNKNSKSQTQTQTQISNIQVTQINSDRFFKQ